MGLQSVQMNDFLIDIREIPDEDSAATIIDVFVDSVLDEKGVKMSFANEFFQTCLTNLENPSVGARTKFLTVFMLKELSLRDKVTRKIFGPFSRHPLYNHLEQMALKTDPKKTVEEKGKNLFPGDKKTGNDFMRIILESMLAWGNRFGSNKQKPTRFTATMESLTQARVVVPKQYIYYSNKGKGETPGENKTKQEISKKSVTKQSIPSSQTATPKPREPKEKYAAEVNYMFNKIENLAGLFEDIDDIDELQKEVNSFHQKFQMDSDKLLSQQEAFLDGQDTAIIDLCFKLIQFFDEEKGLYNLHARNNDYATYMSAYAIAFEKIFQMSTKRQKPAPFKQEPSIEAKVPDKPKTKSSIPPSKPSIASSEYSNKQVESSFQRGSKQPMERERERESRISDGEKVFANFLEKIEKKSQEPHSHFGNVAKSLSKSKLSTVVARKRNPMAVSNFNKSRFGGSSLGKSSAQLKGIFAAPPNAHLKSRNYEGQLVEQLQDFKQLSEPIISGQGHRRFKASHFKSNYILYEDDYIQIGYKSSQIYEKVDKFSSLLLFELFFGNKTYSAISRLNIQFRGDKQSLIYTNPQVIDENLSATSQNRLEVLNIPKAVPFSHISMQLSFYIDGQTRHVAAYLPNSILQMVTYDSLPAAKYTSEWSESVKILKSSSFSLSPSFPPSQLKNLLPSLSENSHYSDFAREGSTTDYELYTEVIVQETYQGILKINVRPDLTVVLQMGMFESEENCTKNFKFYLQSLQMVLQNQN